MTERFRELHQVGAGYRPGTGHGEQLRDSIAEVLDYYRGLFGLGSAALQREAEHFRALVVAFDPVLAEEIEGIAAGAAQAPWLLYALNARSELLNRLTVAECTALVDTGARILAQNWDWGRTLERHLVLLQIDSPGGLRIATLTEPGMLAKVGLNSAGLGVCLNILRHPSEQPGLPVHVVLRAILTSPDLTAVRQLVADQAVGKASHILVANATGDYLSVEFAGPRHFLLATRDGRLCHSNHYQAAEELNTGLPFYSTRERLARAEAMFLTGDAEPWSVLTDRCDGPLSVCRPYGPSESPGFGEVGTVFSLQMDLAARELRIRRGCDPAAPDYRVAL